MTIDKFKPPTSSKGDKAHAITKAGLASVPIVGGTAAELLQFVIRPPLERRRQAWMEWIGEKLQELEKKGLDLESLKDNEEFISATLHATHVALKTHQKEKIKALRNAIANIAQGQSPDNAILHMFLEFIDSFSELHIQILKLFQSPTPPPGVSFGGLIQVIHHNMPQLKDQKNLIDQIWRDLNNRGLVNTDTLHTTMTGSGLGAKRTSDFGDEFLKFIAESE